MWPSRMSLRSAFWLVLLLLVIGCGPYDPKSGPDLSRCYQAEFGTLPPPGITVLNARQVVIRDWGAQWLKIQASSNLIDSVILKSFTKDSHPPQRFARVKERYTPDWWVLPPRNELEYYTCDQWTRGTFHSSSAGIAVHRSTGVIYFRCDRVD